MRVRECMFSGVLLAALASSGALVACDGGGHGGPGPDAQPPSPDAQAPPPSMLLALVNWALDPWLPEEDADNTAQRLAIPSLTQPYYNSVFDVHATTSAANTKLIFSTNGNWHLALRRLLDETYFPANPSVKDSYLITTSPPISVAQLASGRVKVGNVMYTDAQPHVVVAPGGVLDAIEAAGQVDGPRVPIIRTYGNVILKRRGDDRVQTFWDLRHIAPGRFASSDPAEGGSFNNYRNSVLDIALANPRSPELSPEEIEAEAQALQAQLFDGAGVATIGAPMHRSVPHLIATGEADAGLFFLHLAVTAMAENPGVFSAVYLATDRGGETDDPAVLALGQVPLAGNRVGNFAAVRTTVAVDAAQHSARERFIEALQSAEFTDILTDVGLRRPQ
ncbi:MAG: hypothetical protein Tsb0020_22680 [Haliangiales bacterium]